MFWYKLKLVFILEYSIERDFHMSVKVLGSEKDSSYQMINHAFQNRSRKLVCSADVSIDNINENFK